MSEMQLPSRIQPVQHPVFSAFGVEVFMKRDDEIHPVISGNKWRKLIYNFEALNEQGKTGVLTFGGAFSNHLAATAYAAHVHGVPMVAVVRGDEDVTNPTLDFIAKTGAEIKRISRASYAQKNDAEFIANLEKLYPNFLIIPEGGANLAGVRGCIDIMKEVDGDFDLIACPMGSATTFSGLVLGGRQPSFLGFPAVKGGAYLSGHVHNFMHAAKRSKRLASSFTPPAWQLCTDYHFGGFGKVKPELIQFMNVFWEETGIPLDPVYTGKMMFGLVDLIKKGEIKTGQNVLAIHTGGLQGIKGMNERLRKKNLEIAYEEAVAAAFTFPRL